MKHISAVLGPAKKYYSEKFAWTPKRLKCGTFVWLTRYVECEKTWRWYQDAPVVSKLNMSVEEAILEKLKETK